MIIHSRAPNDSAGKAKASTSLLHRGKRRLIGLRGGLVALMLFMTGLARADEPESANEGDVLDPLRERFRAGMDKYRAKAFAEAILIWEKIFAELGAEKGYRLAFNIARAYEKFGDPTRAAENYEVYVGEVGRRRAAGEPLEPNVERQELDAIERQRELAQAQGRIRITSERPVVVRVDGGPERLVQRTGFVAYVTPGRRHVVLFEPGTTDEYRKEVDVVRGDIVDVAPPRNREERADAPLSATRYRTREERPYPPSVLYVATGITAISVLVPVLFYSHADSVRDAYYKATSSDAQRRLHSDYDTARSTAYTSIAAPALLGAATIGLAAYWLFGTKQTRIPISAGHIPGGGSICATGHF